MLLIAQAHKGISMHLKVMVAVGSVVVGYCFVIVDSPDAKHYCLCKGLY